MDKKLFLELAEQAKKELFNKNIKSAFERMGSMLYLMPDSQIEDELNALSNAFEGMLNCVRKGIQDDNRQQSFEQMCIQGWKLHFSLIRKFKCEHTTISYSKAYANAGFHMPYWVFEKDLEDAQNPSAGGDGHVKCYTNLFEQLWTSAALSQEGVEDLKRLFDNENLRLEDKLVVESALLLSALDYPDNHKLALLNELCQSDILEIQVRAMVEMVMLTCALSCYDIFDQELERFGQLMSKGKNQDKLCKIYLHLYQAIHADEFSKELAEKIMPQLRKQQDLGKKIWGNKENPQFSFEFHILQDQMQSSAKTLENLTNNGKDLYLDVFRRFKSFPFFQNIANWFYPFSALHKEAQRVLKGKQASFVQYFVENSPFCDSDKWSMFFLLQSSHANVILPEGFDKSAMPMIKVTWDSLCYDYIHDLYRFYFCSAHNIGSPNPFKLHVDPFTFPTLFEGLDDTHKLVMAEILMNNGGHQSAIDIINAQPVIDFKCHKMLAHCYQHQKDLDQAALHYECCLVEKDDIKIKKRLVSCYEKSAATKQKAVDLLLNLAEQDSQNELKYLFRCATCLMELNKLEEALKLLYKVEFLQPNHEGAKRSIVRCNLLLKQPSKSLTYWKKIKERDAIDWLNGGTVYWALGDAENAYPCYQKFFDEQKHELGGKDDNIRMFRDRISILKSYGISETDINLMLQAINH